MLKAKKREDIVDQRKIAQRRVLAQKAARLIGVMEHTSKYWISPLPYYPLK